MLWDNIDKSVLMFSLLIIACIISVIVLIVSAVKDKSTIFQHSISKLGDYNWLGCDLNRNKSLSWS